MLAASCGGDDPEEPEPPAPAVSLESLSITAPTVKDANRTVTGKAGEYSYRDQADATVRMAFRNAEPAAKDSAIVIPLVSKVTRTAPVTKAALAGDLVLTPVLGGTDRISVKYGSQVPFYGIEHFVQGYVQWQDRRHARVRF